MNAPINVKLQTPTNPGGNWYKQRLEWIDLNRSMGGNPGFYPLTIKAGYVVGIIYDICQCVSVLLKDKEAARDVTYIPAYGLLASSIELLGRAVKGDPSPGGSNLRDGLKWLYQPRYPYYRQVKTDTVLVTTADRSYQIEQLTHLRHFAAHGQATAQFYNVDLQLLEKLRPLLRDGLEHYWAGLQRSDGLCDNLAKANIVPVRGWPVLRSWLLFEGTQRQDHPSITDVFNQFEWSVET